MFGVVFNHVLPEKLTPVFEIYILPGNFSWTTSRVTPARFQTWWITPILSRNPCPPQRAASSGYRAIVLQPISLHPSFFCRLWLRWTLAAVRCDWYAACQRQWYDSSDDAGRGPSREGTTYEKSMDMSFASRMKINCSLAAAQPLDCEMYFTDRWPVYSFPST